MGGVEAWRPRERDGQRIADASIRQLERLPAERQRPRREKTWHRGTCSDDIGESRATVVGGRKIAWLIPDQIVTDDPELLDAVMECVEAAGLELLQPLRDDAAEPSQKGPDHRMRLQGKAMHQNVAPSKDGRIVHQFIDREPNRRVVRRDDGAGADANHDVHLDLMAEKLT